MNIKSYFISILLMVAVGFFPFCSGTPEAEDKPGDVRLVYTDWSESVALTNLARVLLEDHLEYEVIMKLTDVESAYREVYTKEFHLFLDAWLPETHSIYYNQYAEGLTQLAVIYPRARTGLLVPQYSPFTTIEDLKAYEYPLVGIDSGAGVMHKTRIALEKYNLKNPLLSLSEEEMTQILSDSVKRRKNVVVTGWDPHWILSRYALRFLDDPDNIYGESEQICAIGTIELDQTHPRVVKLLERMQFTETQFNRLIYEVRMANDPLQGAKNWINKNTYTVNHWTRGLRPERKKIM